MIKVRHIIPRLAALIAASVLLGSCSKEMDQDKEQLVTVQINLDEGNLTKAGEDPTVQEKVIGSVRIYAYRKDNGDFVGRYYREAASDQPIFMDLALPVRGQYEVLFYIFVNEISVNMSDGFVFPDRPAQDQLSAVRFQSIKPGFPLPMYCIQSETIDVSQMSDNLNTAPGHEDHYFLTKKVTFQLKRPMAKLSVYAAKAQGTEAAKVHSVSYLKAGCRQYIYYLPAAYEILAAVPNRAIGRDLMTEETSLTKMAVSGSTDAEYYHLLSSDTYIPATEVGGNEWQTKVDERQAAVHIQYSVGEDGVLKHGYVYLPKIECDSHYKIYFTITSEGRIILNYKVADWEEADMTNLWFDYPTHSYLEDSTDEDRPTEPAQMSADNPFVCYFKMSYPENEKWRPMILDELSDKVTVKVYKDLQEVSVPVDADPDDWYCITVTPGETLKAGAKVNLAIIYSPSGSTTGEYEYLLINGSQDNYYWPGSTDANKVTITVTE